ncbi:hypothetical protein EV702DRAFT_1050804 [Suillus placidus]|uniref:Uncharacterized protein n=1 Tax=Suillus placidus TaxID=48579 RepID=A0A9P6ZH53_9AGAM|nr:hypothetical protein EV702DRAFT_1050804 [Suillus placidus]
MAPKKWTTDKQEAVLQSLLAEYRTHIPSKNYMQFWPKINKKFFTQWPIHKDFFPDVEDEDELTVEQKKYAKPLQQRKFQIMCWYRWQTNPTCLACSGRSRGVLSLKQTLAGGMYTKGPRALKEVEVYSPMYYADHVKQSADEAIAKGNITSRGSKLRVCRDITAEKYEVESSAVKDKVKRKHKKLWGKEVDNETKLRAIHELPTILDHIFQHLSHMMGGWKFSVLMGGRDPESEGNIYYLRECAAGGQFSDSYVEYGEVLKVYASFVENTIKYEENLAAVEQDNTSEFDHDEEDQSDDDSSSQVGGVQDSVGGDIDVAETVGDRVIREREPDSWESLYQVPNWIPDSNDFNASQTNHDSVDYDSLRRDDYDAALVLLETSLLDLGTTGLSMETGNMELPILPPAPSHACSAALLTPASQPAPVIPVSHPPTPPTPSPLVSHPPTPSYADPAAPLTPASQPAPVIPASHPPTPPTPSPLASQPPMPYLAALPTPDQPVRHTGRARPSVPFNRRELDNGIGGNLKRVSKRKGEDAV